MADFQEVGRVEVLQSLGNKVADLFSIRLEEICGGIDALEIGAEVLREDFTCH